MEYPILYTKNNRKVVRDWSIKVVQNEKNNNYYDIITESGELKGQRTPNINTIISGKNIGKKNETTVYEQACSEALKKWKDKKKVSVEDIALLENHIVFRPMLAEKYQQYNHYIEYPCYVQPKLDGVRCLAYMEGGEVVFISRQGNKYYNFEHIRDDLKNSGIFSKYEVIDGELYAHKLGFDLIVGLCKTHHEIMDKELEKKIKFHIFDCFNKNDLEVSYQLRYKDLYKMKLNNYDYLELVPTSEILDNKKLDKYRDDYINEGYEGLMLRNIKSFYKIQKRSKDLQKYKKMHENEYVIVGAMEASGNDSGTAVWVCDKRLNYDKVRKEMKEGEYRVLFELKKGNNAFKIRPQGDREVRREFFKNKNNYIGKLLTVQYQELSKDDIPRFPSGKAFRDYE